MTRSDVHTLNDALAALREAEKAPGCTMLTLMRAVGLDPKTDFCGGKWRRTDFRNLDLQGFSFRGADLRNARFEESELDRADFRGARITPASIIAGTNWRGAYYDDEQWLALIRQSLAALPLKDRLIEIERMEAGPRPLSDPEWVALIKAALTYVEAHEILVRMNAKRTQPSHFAYSAFIAKAGGRHQEQDARAAFDEFRSLGGQPDLGLYNALIGAMLCYDHAVDIVGEIEAQGWKPDRFTINPLIRLGDSEQSRHWFTRMIDLGLRPDEYSFNGLIAAAEDAIDALGRIEAMKSWGFVPRRLDFNAALKRAVSADQIELVMSEMCKHGIKADDSTLNMLIHKSNSYDSTIDILRTMKRSGYEFDEHTVAAIHHAHGRKHDMIEFAKLISIVERNGLNMEEIAIIPLISESLHSRNDRGREKFWALAKIMEADGLSNKEIFSWFLGEWFDRRRRELIESAEL